MDVFRQNVLLTFRHGMGDAVQMTAVLLHLRHYHPDWNIDVETLVGKHSAFRGLCRKVYVVDRHPSPPGPYQERHTLEWHECREADNRWPNTKVTRCLQDVFHLTPIPELCRYEIAVSETARQKAGDYLESICGPPSADGRYRTVLIHYEGNTSGEQKNLTTELIRQICDDLLRLDHVPVILDWDRRSPLPDNQRIFCPAANHPLWGGLGTGDAEQLTALIAASRLMIGVDSGPLHVAGATTTPTIAVWTKHHPIHFFDWAENVTHLVPPNHADLANGPAALEHFRQHYRHRVYSELSVDLPAVVESELTGVDVELLANKQFLSKLNATGYNVHYYDEHKRAGLDYLGFGEWQQQYGRWMVQSLGYVGRRMLDIGCACGSILRGLGQAGAIVQGVDLCEPMIQLGRQKWPDMSPLLFVCDAVNLHLFKDESWDGLHSAQVAEHWKPELVPFILRELARITVPGGLFFCALDTEELFARQGRTMEHEDPGGTRGHSTLRLICGLVWLMDASNITRFTGWLCLPCPQSRKWSTGCFPQSLRLFRIRQLNAGIERASADATDGVSPDDQPLSSAALAVRGRGSESLDAVADGNRSRAMQGDRPSFHGSTVSRRRSDQTTPM